MPVKLWLLGFLSLRTMADDAVTNVVTLSPATPLQLPHCWVGVGFGTSLQLVLPRDQALAAPGML